MRALSIVLLLGGLATACQAIPEVDGVRYACSSEAPCGSGFECRANVCVAAGSVVDQDATSIPDGDGTSTLDGDASPTGTQEADTREDLETDPTTPEDTREDLETDPTTLEDTREDLETDPTTPEDTREDLETDPTVPEDTSEDADSASPTGTDTTVIEDTTSAPDDADTGPTCVATTELCNDKDDNCNDSTDEGFHLGEPCTVGIGACAQTGVKVCATTTTTKCSVTGKDQGTDCDDANACTKDDACTGGAQSKCQGTSYTCSGACRSCDGDGGCTIAATSCFIDNTCRASGVVDPSNGCQMCTPATSHTAWSPADGRACSDSDACTVGDACLASACAPGDDVLDRDGDGQPGPACGGDDCNDDDASIYRGAPELCDGKANDCDAPDALEPCIDADADGYCPGAAEPSPVCLRGGGDCNDLNPTAIPDSSLACAQVTEPFGNDWNAGVTAFFDGDGGFHALRDTWSQGVLERVSFGATSITARSPLAGDATYGRVAVAPVPLADGVRDRFYFAYQVGEGVTVVGRASGDTLEALRVIDGTPAPSNGGFSSTSPYVAVDASGDVHVVWANDRSQIRHARLSPALRVEADEVVTMTLNEIERLARDNAIFIGGDGSLSFVTLILPSFGSSDPALLRVRTRAANGTWSKREIAAGTVGDGAAIFDTTGHVHACVQADSSQMALLYVTDTSGTLVSSAIPSTPQTNSYSDCSVRVASTGTVFAVWSINTIGPWMARKVGASWSNSRVSTLITEEGDLDIAVAADDTLYLVEGTRWLAKFKGAGWQVAGPLEARPCSLGASMSGAFVVMADGSLEGVGNANYGTVATPCSARFDPATGAWSAGERMDNVDDQYYQHTHQLDLAQAPDGSLVATYVGANADISMVTAVRDAGQSHWRRLSQHLISPTPTDTSLVRGGVADDGTHWLVFVDGNGVLHVYRAPTLGDTLVEQTVDAAGITLNGNFTYSPAMDFVARPSPAISACTKTGLVLYQRGASGWSKTPIDSDPCLTTKLSLDGGSAGITYQASNYVTIRYAFRDGASYSSYELPIGNGEAPAILGTLPAPAELLGTLAYVRVIEAGFFESPVVATPYPFGGPRLYAGLSGARYLVYEDGPTVIYVPPAP